MRVRRRANHRFRRVILAVLIAFAGSVAAALEDRGQVVTVDEANDEITLSTGLVLRINSVPLAGIKPGMLVVVEYDEDDGEAFLTDIKEAPPP